MPIRRAWVPLTAALTVLLAIAIAVPAPADAAFGDRTLRKGMRGHDVRVLQDFLTRVGIETDVDGEFGRGTWRNVRKYERRKRLKVNGVVSRSDAKVLRAEAEPNGAPKRQAPRGKATISGRRAIAPADAPQRVKDVIAAANRIATKPYRYGGGHGSFRDSAYDCSGSVSYALHGGDLLDEPMPSGAFRRWGRRGRGKWITIYANGGHMYMVVAGLRFDTSGRSERGTRWTSERRSTRGYSVRHPAGL